MTNVEIKKEETRKLLKRLQECDAMNVMKAYLEGKEIECSPWDCDSWTLINDPGWSWQTTRYRIKPEPKYRPYRNLYEFAKVVGTPGKCIIRLKNSDKWYIIHAIESKLVVLRTGTKTCDISYETLLNTYEWDDGTPCGILETDNNK